MTLPNTPTKYSSHILCTLHSQASPSRNVTIVSKKAVALLPRLTPCPAPGCRYASTFFAFGNTPL
ncbi:hypothetical protein BCR34DRAFT_565990 [Clohesyomyces aquaticus]|uniref:Uncharacterized protein n=1 Tax=Clohesyomyces aquaticus TaxID=1231657 RepID=A0A1Y1ZLS2_9PLEO|nr:hypothetical protein BCR34DRAFT_565990 [Clohesyomyces aquaticus]